MLSKEYIQGIPFLKTNSQHLKIGQNPKGKACLPTGRLVVWSFGGFLAWLVGWLVVWLLPIAPCLLRKLLEQDYAFSCTCPRCRHTNTNTAAAANPSQVGEGETKWKPAVFQQNEEMAKKSLENNQQESQDPII